MLRDLLIHISQQKSEPGKSLNILLETPFYRIYSDQKSNQIISENFEWISGFPNFLGNASSGHFVKFKFHPDKLLIDLDPLGLRDSFLFKGKNEIIISTRIDWLRNFINFEFDFTNFGSKWLFTHQFNTNAIIKNIERLISSSYEINFATLTVTKKPKEVNFSKRKYSKNNFIELLTEQLEGINNKIALSLSGGLDSRVMLSILLSTKNIFETHSFGTLKSPDVEIAAEIANEFNLEHYFFEDKFNNVDLLANLQKFVVTDQITNPISTAIHLDNYKKLSEKDITIIDGGFGEIWRAEYFKKFHFLPKSTLIDFNPQKLFNEFRLNRADIFIEEINQEMIDGCYNDLSNIKNTLPSVIEIGTQNWLDLLAIKTRLPNFFGYEQKRLDQSLISFMPFVQIPLLEFLFGMPLELRKNGKLFREIITMENKLEKFKLARKDYKIPYKFSSLQTAFLLKFFNKFRKVNSKNISQELFEEKDLILDFLRLDEMRQIGFYDSKKITILINQFYGNDESSYSKIDWLLSFEIFRRQNNINS